MRFDGPSFARAWLAVAAAAATDKDAPPALLKTVIIEEYASSVRLYATDRFILLTAGLPDLDGYYDDGPSFDELPDRVVIAHDGDGLARHLMGHALSLARRYDDEEYTPGQVEVRIVFDVRLPAGSEIDTAIEGMEPEYVVLEIPDEEKVYLPVVVTKAPDWRPIFHEFDAEETKQVALNPEFLERLGKVRRHAAGPLVWRFGGSERAALVDWPESDPHIEGVVVPRRNEVPVETTENEESDDV